MEAEPKSALLLSGITDLKEKKKCLRENGIFPMEETETFRLSRKSYRNDGAGIFLSAHTHTPTEYLSRIRLSLPLCHYRRHACMLTHTRAWTHTHKHTLTQARTQSTCMQSFMQQIVNLKDQSWVPHHISPVMRNSYDHPLFCMHTQTRTHTGVQHLSRLDVSQSIHALFHQRTGSKTQHRACRSLFPCTECFHCHDWCAMNCVCIMAWIQPCLESTPRC